jgi:hypothetical protein
MAGGASGGGVMAGESSGGGVMAGGSGAAASDVTSPSGRPGAGGSPGAGSSGGSSTPPAPMSRRSSMTQVCARGPTVH